MGVIQIYEKQKKMHYLLRVEFTFQFLSQTLFLAFELSCIALFYWYGTEEYVVKNDFFSLSTSL